MLWRYKHPSPLHRTLLNLLRTLSIHVCIRRILCLSVLLMHSGVLLQKHTKIAREILSGFDVLFCERVLLFWNMTRRSEVIGSWHLEVTYWLRLVLNLEDEGSTYLRIVRISLECNAVSCPRRTEFSATPLRKPQKPVFYVLPLRIGIFIRCKHEL
jgi:hypothetical protein